MGSKIRKHSYTIPCSSALRDAVSDLAARRGVNVADLVRSVVLMVPPLAAQATAAGAHGARL
jgi:hypothetical protein